MDYFVGLTDEKWYFFHASSRPDEVNFWLPSETGFRAVQEGSPFLFKLHSPRNCIAGGGFFVRYVRMPILLAWNAFQTKNGSSDLESFRQSISRYRNRETDVHSDIGCIILGEPFFFDEANWIPQPENWKSNIVRGKLYNTNEDVGNNLWQAVRIRLQEISMEPYVTLKEELPSAVQTAARYGSEYLTKPRLGQGAFQTLVLESYSRKCAVSGERTLPALEAAHIKPFARSGPHEVRNGLLLRADIHNLFDSGYMTLTNDLIIEVSQRIREEFENGHDYYAFHGQRLVTLPSHKIDYPSTQYIEWHNTNVYRG